MEREQALAKLAELIREARRRKRLSMERLASRVILAGQPISDSYLCNLEAGHCTPWATDSGRKLLAALCDVLGLDYEYCLHLTGQIPDDLIGMSPQAWARVLREARKKESAGENGKSRSRVQWPQWRQ